MKKINIAIIILSLIFPSLIWAINLNNTFYIQTQGKYYGPFEIQILKQLYRDKKIDINTTILESGTENRYNLKSILLPSEIVEKYYITVLDTVYGPIEINTLKKWYGEKRINANDKVTDSINNEITTVSALLPILAESARNSEQTNNQPQLKIEQKVEKKIRVAPKIGFCLLTGEAADAFQSNINFGIQFENIIDPNIRISYGADYINLAGKDKLDGVNGNKYSFNIGGLYKLMQGQNYFYCGAGLICPWIKFENYSKIGYGGLIKAGYRVADLDISIESTYENADSINWGGITIGLGYFF